ncbi:19526_t:CDS:2, partial [Dentiscutata erythropus]
TVNDIYKRLDEENTTLIKNPGNEKEWKDFYNTTHCELFDFTNYEEMVFTQIYQLLKKNLENSSDVTIETIKSKKLFYDKIIEDAISTQPKKNLSDAAITNCQPILRKTRMKMRFLEEGRPDKINTKDYTELYEEFTQKIIIKAKEAKEATERNEWKKIVRIY